MVVLRVGPWLFDLRVAWHLPWEQFIVRRGPAFLPNQDGWTFFWSIRALHLKLKYSWAHMRRTMPPKVIPKGKVLERLTNVADAAEAYLSEADSLSRVRLQKALRILREAKP